MTEMREQALRQYADSMRGFVEYLQRVAPVVTTKDRSTPTTILAEPDATSLRQHLTHALATGEIVTSTATPADGEMLLLKALIEAETLEALLSDTPRTGDRSFRGSLAPVQGLLDRLLTPSSSAVPAPPEITTLDEGRHKLRSALGGAVDLVPEQTVPVLEKIVGSLMGGVLSDLLASLRTAAVATDANAIVAMVYQLLMSLRETLIALFGERFEQAWTLLGNRLRTVSVSGLVDTLFAPEDVKSWVATHIKSHPLPDPASYSALVSEVYTLRENYLRSLKILSTLTAVACQVEKRLPLVAPQLTPVAKGLLGLIGIYVLLVGADLLDDDLDVLGRVRGIRHLLQQPHPTGVGASDADD